MIFLAVIVNVDTSLEQSPSVALGTENEDECRAVIEQIRREEFGIGLELGEVESKLRGARVAQWCEHSSPTNVARVRILALTPYVG